MMVSPSGRSMAVSRVPILIPRMLFMDGWNPPTSTTLPVSESNSNVEPPHTVSARESISALACTEKSVGVTILVALPARRIPVLTALVFRRLLPCAPNRVDADGDASSPSSLVLASPPSVVLLSSCRCCPPTFRSGVAWASMARRPSNIIF